MCDNIYKQEQIHDEVRKSVITLSTFQNTEDTGPQQR
jgi:hypothetical protein